MGDAARSACGSGWTTAPGGRTSATWATRSSGREAESRRSVPSVPSGEGCGRRCRIRRGAARCRRGRGRSLGVPRLGQGEEVDQQQHTCGARGDRCGRRADRARRSTLGPWCVGDRQDAGAVGGQQHGQQQGAEPSVLASQERSRPPAVEAALEVILHAGGPGRAELSADVLRKCLGGRDALGSGGPSEVRGEVLLAQRPRARNLRAPTAFGFDPGATRSPSGAGSGPRPTTAPRGRTWAASSAPRARASVSARSSVASSAMVEGRSSSGTETSAWVRRCTSMLVRRMVV